MESTIMGYIRSCQGCTRKFIELISMVSMVDA